MQLAGSFKKNWEMALQDTGYRGMNWESMFHVENGPGNPFPDGNIPETLEGRCGNCRKQITARVDVGSHFSVYMVCPECEKGTEIATWRRINPGSIPG